MIRRIKNYIPIALCLLLQFCLCCCNTVRHVPDGEYLLDKVHVNINSDQNKEGVINKKEMTNYLTQQPNHRILWSGKFRLGLYSLSGTDTTKWLNRWFRKVGEKPVIFDESATISSADQLKKVMINKGYLHADVEIDTLLDVRRKKAVVNYTLNPGERYNIRNIDYKFPDDSLRNMVLGIASRFPVGLGSPLDRELLESQREIITNHLRNKGYYGFTKEFISFNADTIINSNEVDLTMKVNPPFHLLSESDSASERRHTRFLIRDVNFVTDYNPTSGNQFISPESTDTIEYNGIRIYYGKKHYLRPKALSENCFIVPGSPYNEHNVNRTYQALSRLSILQFISIRFVPVEGNNSNLLDAYILLTPGKSQSVTFELEGTNSEGDLGVAASAAYTHRNISRGSETLTTKIRGAYESISGKLEGFIHNRYLEFTGEVGIDFPKFKAPFLKESFKRKINATTELNVSVNYQERPEYTRIISTAGWAYKWIERITRNRHTFTLIDINYVYLPQSTYDFINQIAPDNPLLRYSYEDHFIMRCGYSFYHSNKQRDVPWSKSTQRDIWNLRVNAEIAGNLLFALSNIFSYRKNFHTDPYKIFGINYSQYFKAEGDYGYMHVFDSRNSLACHAGLGIAVPYGNSSILPFEKRFYGGGSNGVRGWAVRTLGPGSYPGTNSVNDFINQCGDIRIDLSAEYRAKLFWVIELGIFVDAGNIWTIREYSNQPGGVFRFNRFYKEIAVAYGAGIRLDFNYFLLRLDLGMKAHNPALGEEPWPIIHPNWKRDSSIHFSIGYPF